MNSTTDDGFIDPMANPALANAQIASVLEDANASDLPAEPPSIPNPRDGFVRLPGGIDIDGVRVHEAEVRELTGKDEERLVRARTSDDPGTFLNVLLECGVTSIGGKPAKRLLGDLLIGDRDALILAIREATYGPEIDLGPAHCNGCLETFDLVGQVSDIPVVTPKAGEDFSFEVPLRKGGTAYVHLPTGDDQVAYLKNPALTVAERNSVLLSRVVDFIEFPNGEREDVVAMPSIIMDLGVVDRRKVLDQIANRMPGPRYDEYEIEHECGEKIPAPIGLMSLFPGL